MIPLADVTSYGTKPENPRAPEAQKEGLKMKNVIVALILFMAATVAVAQEWPDPIQPQELVTHMLARPCRVLDTRIVTDSCQAAVIWPSSVSPYVCPRGKVNDGEVRFLQFQAGAACFGSSQRPVPLGARGLIVTVTAVEPTGDGHLILYDPYPLTGESGPPSTSTLNFTAGQNVAVTAFSALGQFQFQSMSIPFAPDTALKVRVADGGQVHVVMDVVGYLQEQVK